VERAEDRHAGAQEAQDPRKGTEGGVVGMGEIGAQNQRAVQGAEQEVGGGAAVLAFQRGDGNDPETGGEIKRPRLGRGAHDIEMIADAVVRRQVQEDVLGDAVGAGEGGKGFAAQDGDVHPQEPPTCS
jgi:hypothetical protein